MKSTRKVAIVTGGGRGIGAATAQRLAAEGAAVAIVDLDAAAAMQTAKALSAQGYEAIPLQADITVSEQVDGVIDEVHSLLGRPAILVNNAGVIRDNLLFRMSEMDWDQVIDVHLKGAFLMSRGVQADMVEAGWGRIVNLSSSSALGNRGQANYATAKAGIQGLTKTLSMELGKFGITVNAVAPGFIQTDMTAQTAERLNIPFEKFIEMNAESIPVRRVGQPEDVASAIAYFCSEPAGFVSGQVLYVAGGPLN